MTLKKTLGTAAIAAAALAMTFGATIARADYNGGGPIKSGEKCWQATDGRGHGLWHACPAPLKVTHHARAHAVKNTKLSHN